MNFAITILGLICIVILSGDYGVLGETEPEWRKKALDRHNFHRAKHGVPLLKQSEELCNISQIYANHLRDTNTFNHSTSKFRKGYGENMWKACCSDRKPTDPPPKPEDIVDAFYNEIQNYDFDKGWAKAGKTFYNIGHFTQAIWKGTSEVCVSYAVGKRFALAVANYRPSGNLEGTYLRNVPRKINGGGTNVQKVQSIFKVSICLALTNYLIYPFG